MDEAPGFGHPFADFGGGPVAEEVDVGWKSPTGQRGVAGAEDHQINVAQAWVGEGIEQGINPF